MEREVSGSVLRGDVAWLERNGLKAQVRERLAPETQAVFDNPPLPVTWMPARHTDALHEALHAIGGEEKVVQLGQEAARANGAAMLRPLLTTVLSLFGASPAALFGRMDALVGMYVKGTSFSWEPAGERGGVMRMRNVDRAPAAWYLRWKGPLLFAFEVASVKGSVEACEMDPDGMGAVYRVAWS